MFDTENHKDATIATPFNTCTGNTTSMLMAKYGIETNILDASCLTTINSDFTYWYDVVVKFPVSNQNKK